MNLANRTSLICVGYLTYQVSEEFGGNYFAVGTLIVLLIICMRPWKWPRRNNPPSVSSSLR